MFSFKSKCVLYNGSSSQSSDKYRQYRTVTVHYLNMHNLITQVSVHL